MAQLSVLCGGCKRKLRVPVAYVGKKMMCPTCQAQLVLPSVEEVEAVLPRRYVIMPMHTKKHISNVFEVSSADPSHSMDDTVVVRHLNPRKQLDGGSLDDMLDNPEVVYEDGAPPSAPAEPRPKPKKAKAKPEPKPEPRAEPKAEPTPEPTPEAPARAAPANNEGAYEIHDRNRVVILDPGKPGFKGLAGTVADLPASRSDPIIIDLTPMERLYRPVLQRVLHAALSNILTDRPTALHIAENHKPQVESFERALDITYGPGGIPSPPPAKRLDREAEPAAATGAADQTPSQRRGKPRPEWDGVNRRKSEQFCVDIAEIELHKATTGVSRSNLADVTQLNELIDLSMRGCGVYTSKALSEGDQVKLNLRVPNLFQDLGIVGKVVWVEPDARGNHRAGVLFRSLPSAAVIKLRRLRGKFAAG